MEKIKTSISFSITFFFENRAVLERTWRNHAEPSRSQITTWRMRITYWITEAANTLSGYVTFVAFPLQKLLHKSAALLRHTYVAYPVSLCNVNYILCTKFCMAHNFFDIKKSRSENDFTSYICGLYTKKFSINCTAVILLPHVCTATNETFIISSN